MQFDAHFSGEPDFDVEFPIEGPDGTLMGRCGCGVAAQIEDQVVAVDVWLQPASIRHPEVIFLLTEYAMNDSGIYHTLSDSGIVERIQRGQTFQLEAGGMTLRATLDDLQLGSEVIDVYARRTILDRLLGREHTPVTVLTPADYITGLRMSLVLD